MKRLRAICFVLLLALSLEPCIAQSKTSRIEVFKDFYQGDRGNCVYVATIKAAVMTFGIDSVFKRIEVGEDSLMTVTLRNAKTIVLTKAELHEAKKASHFKKNNSDLNRVYNFAAFCYSVMAKVRQKENQGYSKTLEEMSKGEYVINAFSYLGLSKYVTQKNPLTRTKGKCPIIVGNRKHAAYACYGDMDLWGKTKKLKWWWYWGRFEISPSPNIQ